jgi:hypothetical protein
LQTTPIARNLAEDPWRHGVPEAEGCRDDLIVWNDTLIDGHNRHKICTARNIPFSTAYKEFLDRDDAKLWIIDNQLGRRNLTPFVRTELHLKKKAILAAEAKKHVIESGKQTGRGNKKVSQNSVKPLDTQKTIAKAADVSWDTVSRVEKIIAKAAAPVLEKLRKGETSINEAYTTIRYAEKEAAREERREENRTIIQKAVRTRAHKGFPPLILSFTRRCLAWSDTGSLPIQLIVTFPHYSQVTGTYALVV